jgi:hypothetical protein
MMYLHFGLICPDWNWTNNPLWISGHGWGSIRKEDEENLDISETRALHVGDSDMPHVSNDSLEHKSARLRIMRKLLVQRLKNS